MYCVLAAFSDLNGLDWLKLIVLALIFSAQLLRW